jgi:hypothetical protein
MIDTQSHYYNQYQSNLSNWSVDLWFTQYSWIGKLGFRSQHLDTHPRADDCVFLLKLRIELWEIMNTSERAVWGAYWGIVFAKKKPLNHKAYTKFEKHTQSIILRQSRIQSQIQSLRATKHNQNKGRNMTANCPDQPDSKLVKQESLGGREDQQLLLW